MGKFTRPLAIVHDYTTEPVLDKVVAGGSLTKKLTLKGVNKVRSGLSNLKSSFAAEHTAVEERRAVKVQMAEAVEETRAKMVKTTKAKVKDPVGAHEETV